MNRVMLTGRLVKDPELRRTNTDIPVVQFTLAVNRSYASRNGERQADFINCVIWRQQAENFAKYLHKLTKSTQFIVITHRRGTMTAADRLYGITMQEKGVSALVSVDLIEKDFIEQLGITLTGHLDPITIDDERVNALKATTENIVTQIDPRFSIHDFRMVFGKDNTNVLFDLAIPYECSNQKEQIKAILEQKFADMEQNYRLVITIEPSL